MIGGLPHFKRGEDLDVVNAMNGTRYAPQQLKLMELIMKHTNLQWTTFVGNESIDTICMGTFEEMLFRVSGQHPARCEDVHWVMQELEIYRSQPRRTLRDDLRIDLNRPW
jgi:hypothetical protein